MTVRIVTDSTADLPGQLVRALGIVVVPLHIYFGADRFRDGVSISHDEFYRRLTARTSPLPRTAAPSSADFASAYDALARESDGIVSIHLSSALSATYRAAVLGVRESTYRCRTEVVDSTNVSVGLGLLVLQAAELARDGASVDQILDATRSAIPRIRFFGVLDTLEYLRRGGRIGRASALLGSVLQVKPIVGLVDGAAYPIERARGRRRAVARVCELISDCGRIARIAVAHTTDEAGMESLAEYVNGIEPELEVVRARCGATLGTYLGPGAFGTGLILAGS
ncbi:MAG: DegV family protein [Chloroflexota bacterium]